METKEKQRLVFDKTRHNVGLQIYRNYLISQFKTNIPTLPWLLCHLSSTLYIRQHIVTVYIYTANFLIETFEY